MEGTTRDRLRPAVLVRKVLLPPVLAGVAIACLLGALAITAVGGGRGGAGNPLATNAHASHRALAKALSLDLEGTPSARDIRVVRRPLSERQRLLRRHPYYALYVAAQRRFHVPWVLVASMHYQDTGFERSESRHAARDVLAIAASLRAARTSDDLGPAAARALRRRYGPDPVGEVSAAMVLERARAWRLLGTIPMPGHGELERPVDAPIGGCGYFGCPRPGHLHNGDDFLAPAGTPVHAADVGTVAFVQTPAQSGGYGNFVCIQHRPHLASCYAHLSVVEPQVKAGARVRRGEVIGLVGSTGSSTAPHLHFEIRRGPASCQACAVDPMPLLSSEIPQRTVANMLHLAAVSASLGAPATLTAPAPASPASAGSNATSTSTSTSRETTTTTGPGVVRGPAGATTSRAPAVPATTSRVPLPATHSPTGARTPSTTSATAPAPTRTASHAAAGGPTIASSSSGGAAAPGPGTVDKGAAPSTPSAAAPPTG